MPDGFDVLSAPRLQTGTSLADPFALALGADAITDAIHRVLDDPGLARDLRARGLARARRFTWLTSAAGLVASGTRALAAAG